MKELFMVDQNTLIVLVALVLFVIFVIIYKSKQNSSTTYYNDDEAYEDIAEIEEVKKDEIFENKTTKKLEDITDYDEAYEDITDCNDDEDTTEIENRTTEKLEESEEEIEFDIKPILIGCLVGMYTINKRLDVLGVLWSLVFTVLVSVVISIFVPKEILRRFFPKKPKNNDD